MGSREEALRPLDHLKRDRFKANLFFAAPAKAARTCTHFSKRLDIGALQ